MKKYTLGFVLIVLLSMAMSVAALEYKTIYRQQGTSAFAEWIEIEGNLTNYTDLSVTKTEGGSDIWLSICSVDAGFNYSCKSGYKFTEDNVFDIDNKLTAATLSPVKIDLYDFNGTVEKVTIKSQWAGIGDVTKGSFKYMSKFGDFIEKFSTSSSFREAKATGSIYNDINKELGTSNYGSMAKFKSASISMKK